MSEEFVYLICVIGKMCRLCLEGKLAKPLLLEDDSELGSAFVAPSVQRLFWTSVPCVHQTTWLSTGFGRFAQFSYTRGCNEPIGKWCTLYLTKGADCNTIETV